MLKSKTPTLELFQLILSVIAAQEDLENRLKLLRRKRLISPATWRQHVLPAQRNLTETIDDAWRRLHRKAAVTDFPELINEEDVKRLFGISHKTLYRRRSKRELPYVKDKEGNIWYPLYDLLDYVLRSKPQKTGRPRKF